MIYFNGVWKQFKNNFWDNPQWVLKGLDFSIAENQVIGFLGANGAGKTTSLKILMGFIKADKGQVEFSPELGGERSQALAHIGFMPERPYFYPHLTGWQFLTYLGQLAQVDSALVKKRIRNWSERVSIDQALGRKIKSYSKGMLQRLGLVSTLIGDPKLVILDEPLSGLDPVGRKQIKGIIGEINREGKTVLFSSHIVSDVEEVCQKVIFLEKGQLMYGGSIEDLLGAHQGSHYHLSLKKTKGCQGKQQWQTSVLKVEEGPGGWLHLQVEKSAREQLLLEAIEAGYRVQRVEQERASLEQIIYNVRGEK